MILMGALLHRLVVTLVIPGVWMMVRLVVVMVVIDTIVVMGFLVMILILVAFSCVVVSCI